MKQKHKRQKRAKENNGHSHKQKCLCVIVIATVVNIAIAVMRQHRYIGDCWQEQLDSVGRTDGGEEIGRNRGVFSVSNHSKFHSLSIMQICKIEYSTREV